MHDFHQGCSACQPHQGGPHHAILHTVLVKELPTTSSIANKGVPQVFLIKELLVTPSIDIKGVTNVLKVFPAADMSSVLGKFVVSVRGPNTIEEPSGEDIVVDRCYVWASSLKTDKVRPSTNDLGFSAGTLFGEPMNLTQLMWLIENNGAASRTNYFGNSFLICLFTFCLERKINNWYKYTSTSIICV